ncbi:Uma2 family endonuclease [Streptomyces sp. MST-110588]|uniref:Uma2 family endonuclease n=1 Tax=Streptomyces sp. MST-110588 TaxID=2833628 RepID=UPI001F5D5CBB|nr:Uma2 family endonuclease [Streptomyces sp. MST-110588]UNO44172.1 Uma2 family endonuclease [Streptomyces sp. MST-110588]
MPELLENLQVPDGLKAELLRGEIVLTASPDWVHNCIVTDVMDQIPRQRWRRVQTQDVDILGENSEPVPDLVVLERGAGPVSGRLLPSAVLTLLVEVVSRTSVERDYDIKRSVYAAGRVPAYLIIDPLIGRCVLLTEPTGSGDGADYAVQRITEFGDPVPLDLLDVGLDTRAFRTLPHAGRHSRP